MENFKQFMHSLFAQFFKEHLIIALLSQFIQDIKDRYEGQDEHFKEHFW